MKHFRLMMVFLVGTCADQKALDNLEAVMVANCKGQQVAYENEHFDLIVFTLVSVDSQITDLPAYARRKVYDSAYKWEDDLLIAFRQGWEVGRLRIGPCPLLPDKFSYSLGETIQFKDQTKFYRLLREKKME